MKNIALSLTLLILVIGNSSCKKKGCTVTYAINFNHEAVKDDNSCVFYTNGSIAKIELLKFPKYDANGHEWDDDSKPDFYIRFTDSLDGIKYQTNLLTNIDTNIFWGIPSYVSFDMNTGLTKFKVYEVDEFTTELMGVFPVNFNDYMHESESGLEKYPDSTIIVKDSLELKLHINWLE